MGTRTVTGKRCVRARGLIRARLRLLE
jgi:hypothetical protein